VIDIQIAKGNENALDLIRIHRVIEAGHRFNLVAKALGSMQYHEAAHWASAVKRFFHLKIEKDRKETMKITKRYDFYKIPFLTLAL